MSLNVSVCFFSYRAVLKETKKFFGLDDCDKQQQLWEERRRRHACRSGGALKESHASLPGYSRQASQAQRVAPSFRAAAQSVAEVPSAEAARASRTSRAPALLTVLEEVKHQDSAKQKTSALHVDVDRPSELVSTDVSTPSPKSFDFPEVATVRIF